MKHNKKVPYTLYNGDCLDILEELNGSSNPIDTGFNIQNAIFVSDPPFNVGYHYKTYTDKKNEIEYYEWLAEIFRDNKQVIVHYPESLYKYAFQIGMFPEKVISWIYNSNTAKQHRDIAFFGVKPDMRQVGQPYKNPKDKRIAKRIADGKTARLYDWWEINQVKNVSKKFDHPCVMPVDVMKRVVGILPYNATIIDPFLGSGTTGIAVIEMNKEQDAQRKFIGIEIDTDYYNIAVTRMKEAEKNDNVS